jgi:hypothetical protein
LAVPATWRIALSRSSTAALLAVMSLVPMWLAVPAMAAPPVVVLSAPATAVTGAPVAFDGEDTTDPDGDLVSYRWAIDGQTLDVENPWLAVAFAHPGRHVVALTATDDHGEAATAQHQILLTGADRSAASLKPFGGSVAPGVKAAPELVVRAPAVRLRRHRLRVELRCRGAARCTGTLRAVAMKGPRRLRAVLLAQRRFSVARGHPRIVHVRLSRRARQRLGARTTVRVTAFRGTRVRVSALWDTAAYVVPVAR